MTALQLIETLESGGQCFGAYVALAEASHALQPPKGTESTSHPALAGPILGVSTLALLPVRGNQM